jgi:hypothetical protein
VVGYQYAPYAQNLLDTFLQPASGNRYLFKLANAFEAGSKFFSNVDWMEIDPLNALSAKAAQGLTTIENGLRSKAVSGRWYYPDENTILKRLLKNHDVDVKHMQDALARDVEAMTKSGASPDLIAARQAKTAEWIKSADQKLSSLKDAVLNAVKETKADPAYAHLSREAQADKILDVSKKAGKIKFVPTIRWGITVASAVLSGYYAAEWLLEANREKDPVLRENLNQHYGSKLIASLLYLIPVAGEAEFAIDAVEFVAEKVAPVAHLDLDLPRSQEMIYQLIKHSGDPALWAQGTNRMKMFIQNEYVNQEIPGLPAKMKNGEFIDNAILVYRRAKSSGEDMAAAREALMDHVKLLGRKYLVYSFSVSNEVNGFYNRDADDFFWKNTIALTSPGNGYFDVAVSELNATDPSLDTVEAFMSYHL